MKKVRSTFQIIGGKFDYRNPNFEQGIKELRNCEGEFGECIYEIVDRVQLFQHRYYRGYILPDITYFMGEVSTNKVHIELKKEFLYQKIENGDWTDIPVKHQSRSIIVTKEKDGQEYIDGYIPSTANLTYAEMKEFIQKCEHRLFVDLPGRFKQEQDAMEYKKLSTKE